MGRSGAALSSVVAGANTSIEIDAQDEPTLYAGFWSPSSQQTRLVEWSAWVEGGGLDGEEAFAQLQTVDGLSWIALSWEDSPDFEFEHITEGTFPWGDWRLQQGAVRDENGEWIVRPGECAEA